MSVIVPVRDGAEFLRRLVPALENQTLARGLYEVIVADDGSSDGVLDGIAEESELLRVSSGPPQTSDAARNRGAAEARGRALAFIDADCIPSRDWLEGGLRALDEADMVAGAVRFDAPSRRTVWTLIDMETTKNQERHVRLGNAETANLFVRRALFEQLGGFDPAFPYHGDFDLARRCVSTGGRLVYCAGAVVSHPTRQDGRQYLRMAWRSHHSYAARTARDGDRPNALKLRNWVPVVQTWRGRRRVGKPFGLDRTWLAANAVTPTAFERLVSLPILYLVLPYMGGVAEVLGARQGRKLRGGTIDPGP